jgi:hypothetical protein
MLKRALFCILALFAGVSAAQAQVNVTYYDFEGRGFVTTSPTSAACQADGIVFGSVFTDVYRFTLNPAIVSDALSFTTGDRATFRISSTTGPNFSLNGAVNTNWDYINTRAFAAGGPIPSSSDLAVSPFGTTTILQGALNIKIVGTINDFIAISGCTVSYRAALTRRLD